MNTLQRTLTVAIIGAASTLAAARADEGKPQYRKLRVIDSIRGDGPGQLTYTLRGINVGPDGNLYVVGDSKVLVVSPEGKVLRGWKTGRPGYCITVAPDGTAYVGQQGQVQIFDADGQPVASWDDAEHLMLVTAIAVTDNNTVLCADARGRCVRRLDTRGKHLGDIGKDGRTRGFMVPNGHLDFALGKDGTLRIADPGRHRVTRWNLDGRLLDHFGRFDTKDPAGFTGCCNPTSLALTPGGQIVAFVKAPPGVRVYNQDGELLASLGEADFDPNCKNADLIVDAQGRIFVIEPVHLQIIVYEPVDKRAATPATERQP